MVRVTIYTRRACHLCELAMEAIAGSGCRDLFEIEEIDVDSDPELQALYTNDVPVVLIDRTPAFWHHIDPVLFRRAIEEIARTGSTRPEARSGRSPS